MENSFPTVTVFKESARLPLKYVGSMLMSLLFVVGAVTAAIFLVAIIAVLVGFDIEAFAAFSEAAQRGESQDVSALDGLGWMFLGGLIAMFFVLVVTAHIFNFWVNLAAYGRDEARWSFADGRFSTAMVNGVKFFFIGILIGIVQLVVTLALASFGLSASLAEQAAITSYSAGVMAGLSGTIIGVIVTSGVYSAFSANLTQTALKSDAEGMEHPHTVDFAIVLVLLYALYLVPTVVFALSGSDVMTIIGGVIFGLYLMFTVPVAHGLRYRICVAEKGERDTHG